MVDVQVQGSANRIKRSAFDLLSIRDYLIDDQNDHDEDDDEEEVWDFIGSMFGLKTTFMYCDFNQMIAHAPTDQKEALTQLANKLFSSIEELDHAVKIRNIPMTQDRYNEAAVVLQEVVAFIP